MVTVLERLADDLTRVPGCTLSRAEIVQVLRASMRDLAGSVTPASMPEMAARLACARIGLQPGATAA